MPSRRDIFLNNHIYHIFNKTIDRKLIFDIPEVADYFMQLLGYYRSIKTKVRYSVFRRLQQTERQFIEKAVNIKKNFRVEIQAFCLMPNHFHLLLKQKKDDGIVRFLSDVTNALTRYHNELYKRKGPLFLPQFRSRMIVSPEQYIHVSRYIHLNPYSAYVVNTIDELFNYPYSSLKAYIDNTNHTIADTKQLLYHFNDDGKRYGEFVISNAQHQRTLEYVKYIDKWDK